MACPLESTDLLSQSLALENFAVILRWSADKPTVSISSIASTGLNQAQTVLDNTAKRISGASGQSDSVGLSTDAVSLIQAKNDFEANINAIKVGDALDKSTISLLA